MSCSAIADSAADKDWLGLGNDWQYVEGVLDAAWTVPIGGYLPA